MKRHYFYIITLVCTIAFAACSPQKRLAELLTRHPELNTTSEIVKKDTIYITDTLYIPTETKSYPLTLDYILRMDSAAGGTDAIADTESCKLDKQTVIETQHAGAAFEAMGNGLFKLTAYSKPDTIIVKDTIYKYRTFYIPTYLTDTKVKEVEVYKMKHYEKFFYNIGIAFIISLILCFAHFIISRIRK